MTYDLPPPTQRSRLPGIEKAGGTLRLEEEIVPQDMLFKQLEYMILFKESFIITAV